MSELIDRQAFIEQERRLYCEDCDRRKGKKNGKLTVCYEIGEAPCRACWLDDALTDLEDFPAASPWHRVEEELPPKGFALIGARKRPPEISEDFWDMWVCEYDGEWGWQDMDGYALRGITHWMPIEPPGEENNGSSGKEAGSDI